MHQVIYIKKLECKCTITQFDPRFIYIGAIQAKGYLSFRDTCLSACSDARHISILCSIGQLPMHISQLFARYASYLYYFLIIFIKKI